jgi:prolyl-tRNA synthetase
VEEYVWATSWGVSTRLVGGLIMTHSDDDGLVLPPRLAPTQVIIVPIPKPAAEIDEAAEKVMKELKTMGITVKYDTDMKNRPGFKFAQHELHGIPVRIAIGARDLANGQVEVARRDTKEKENVPIEGVARHTERLLSDIQNNLFQKALNFRKENTTKVDTFQEMQEVLDSQGGFVSAHWDGTTETELKIKDLTKATIRCIPNDAEIEKGSCVLTGKPSEKRVLYARAY